jgi:uncharacterized protein (TIGR02611 family)
MVKPSSVERQPDTDGADTPELRRYGVTQEREEVADPTDAERRLSRLRTTLDIIRATPTGRIALRIAVALAGALVVGVGIFLIPLPGPGWLIVIGGLAIWAVEFAWARRLLAFTKRHVQAWTRWVTRQSLPLRLLIGVVGLIFVSAVVWLSVRTSFGIDLVTEGLKLLRGE